MYDEAKDEWMPIGKILLNIIPITVVITAGLIGFIVAKIEVWWEFRNKEKK